MPHTTDLDLTAKDVAELASPDAITALLTKLGYDTADRTALSPEAVGLAGESASAIKKIELLSEDPEQFLRVVFAQPKSLTAKVRNDLVRVLGKSNLDHLLVLASDFDTLEFVFLDKRKREQKGPAGGERIQVVPKTFKLDRRHSTLLERRILRRFTWTCRDALEQFDKLRSVFDAAAYTGEYFQNRGLFSDYFLRDRLREDPAWRDNPSETFAFVRDLMRDAQTRWNGKDKDTLKNELLEPLFKKLGFKAKVNRPAKTTLTEPDYLLNTSDGGKLTAAFVYAWDRWLDGPDLNDADTPEENPGACVVTALDAGTADWIIVTNGRLWRLYSRQAHARATNFYEVDLAEALTASGDTDPNEAFRYWWLFMRPAAFTPKAEGQGCWLDDILLGSREYAKRLGDRLKDRIFLTIFPNLAQGFLVDRKQRLGVTKATTDEELADIFEATLTLLYRLLFLLYAESRDLLPIREAPYQAASFKKIKDEIADKAGVTESDVAERLDKAYSPKETALYDRLCKLFVAMDKGDPILNVPIYNGGLFNTKPDKSDRRDQRIARFLTEHKVPDRYLALAIDRLARDQDERTLALVFIDYKSLEVRHLGSIYEGLLEFKLKVADEDLTTQADKKGETYIPLSQTKVKRGKQAAVVVKKKDVYLSNDKAERKASGSYYTPDPIVEYIVAHTVGPVLEEKLEALRPEFRKVRKTFERLKANADTTPHLRASQDSRAYAQAATFNTHKDLVEQLFDLRVLDPAMGSGHFLVETVDFVTDHLLKFLNQFPINPVNFALDRTRNSILESLGEQGVTVDPAKLTDINLLKRHVLKRCIYGVDLNPMAVELAKVSLWLDAFTLGAPLNFLDHHLRCGNSLIGATFKDLETATATLFGLNYEPLLRAINHVLFVSKIADATAAEVATSVSRYDQARQSLAGYQIILDLIVAEHFGLPEAIQLVKYGNHLDLTDPKKFDASLHDDQERKLVAKVEALAQHPDRRFFHWEIEFPEVFFGFIDADERHIKHKDQIKDGTAGFDCVVGNPPYVRVQELRQSAPETVDYFKGLYRSAYKNFDISVLFFERALGLTKRFASFIASNKWLSADYGAGLRAELVSKSALDSVVHFGDFQIFDDATTYTGIVSLTWQPRASFSYTDARSGKIGVPIICPMRSLPATGAPWVFAVGQERTLLERLLLGKGPTLGQLRLRAFQGLRTSDNDVYVLTGQVNAGAAYAELISKATGKAHCLESGVLKPLVPGNGIRAFSIAHSDQWLIFPYSLDGNRPALLTERRFKQGFPEAWGYLKECEERLRARERGKMDGPDWWAYVYPKNLDQFEQPKIMLPDYHDSPAALDLEGRYYSITAYCLTLKPDSPLSLHEVAALLNSRLLFWVLSKIGTALQRGFVRFMPQYLDQLPVLVPAAKEKARLEELANTALLEGFSTIADKLNDLVCDLYGLTADERAFLQPEDQA